MKDNNHITDEMLVRYILGEASLQERLSVQEWVNADKENKNHLDELTLIWKESGKLMPTTSLTTEEAWEHFKGRINKGTPSSNKIRTISWLRAAAILLVLVGGWLSWAHFRQTDASPAPIASNQEVPVSPSNEPSAQTDITAASNTPLPDTDISKGSGTEAPVVQKKKEAVAARKKVEVNELHKNTRTKEFICNATPCPLEICIVQTIRCSNGKPSSVATCNLLQPDQSGQLHYKAIDNTLGENCHAMVSEIRIKRVTTGETIVLNNNSKPSTAEELFNYLTGNCTANGDILAGIFETDCDNSCSQNKLKIGNNFGHLILE